MIKYTHIMANDLRLDTHGHHSALFTDSLGAHQKIPSSARHGTLHATQKSITTRLTPHNPTGGGPRARFDIRCQALEHFIVRILTVATLPTEHLNVGGPYVRLGSWHVSLPR